MSILLDDSSRVLIQGITGKTGASFARRMLKSGTPLVAGVTPGKGGRVEQGVPVFDTVEEATQSTGATDSLIVVPPTMVKSAFLEAMRAGIHFMSIYTEHVPVHDVAGMLAASREKAARFLGPNSAGIVSPGKANLSDINDANVRPGTIGIVSKSGTLAGEVILGLHDMGLGESTVVCLGGDPILGTTFVDVLPLFAADPDTDVVVLVGEIGGDAEIEAARMWHEMAAPKPLVAYIAGQSAPPGRRMGHAGAIANQGSETAQEKQNYLKEAGAHIAQLVTDIPALVARAC